MDISNLYDLYLDSQQKIFTDTRKPKKEGLFFALSGENFNGNKFAQEALNKGARHAIIDDEKFNTSKYTILVKNVLNTLQELARFHRDKVAPKVIGLTGTNGKTTTKELIASVLGQAFKTHSTKGNFNNLIGVPLTLLEMPLDTEFAVIEMGASEKNEIAKLCMIADPDFGLITNIGQAHIEGFESFEGVIEAKMELYDYAFKNNKYLFVFKDNPLLMKHAPSERVTYYSMNQEDEGNEQTYSYNLLASTPHINLRFIKDDRSIELESVLFGTYNFVNIIAALTIGQYFGVATEKLLRGIEKYRPQNNRSQIINFGSNKIVMDAYNANPSSVSSALRAFSAFSSTNKWVILGDMKELGNISNVAHQSVVDALKEMGLEKVILVGEAFGLTSSHDFEVFENVDALKLAIDIKSIQNKLIFIKGSRSMHLEDFLKL